MTVTLNVTNRGADPLPFGCGFHPWFPRGPDTRLSFQASAVWLEDQRNLPTKKLAVEEFPVWDFARSRALPDSWINNAYTGWTGSAQIEQGPGAVSCRVAASANLDAALVYSPDAKADFFCFEPVSHPVDAFHLPGHPGLRELQNDETLSARMHISWSPE